MTTQTEALKLALEALEKERPYLGAMPTLTVKAITAIKEALAQPEQEPKCNPHPKAPHGFNRNASHANDRYTCECEGWDAYDAGYQAGVMAGIEAVNSIEHTTPPQRTWVGLTDEDVKKLRYQADEEDSGYTRLIKATEAKLNEKNTLQYGDCKHCVNGCLSCDARRQPNVLP